MIQRLARLLLAFYPERFRREHGQDLIDLYADLHRSRPWPARWMAWPITIVDILASGISMRIEHRRDARGSRTGGGGGVIVGNLTSDVRHGLRSLLRSPGFTGVALTTLALGIGANAAIFSVVRGVLLKPLDYDRPEELVSVRSRFLPVSGFDFQDFDLDPTEYLDYRDTNRTFAGFAAWYGTGVTHTAEEVEPERVSAVVATWDLLPLLGAKPHLGRLFVEEDDLPGAPDRLILSHPFWARAYGSDPAVVGRSITVNGRPFEVVGVLAEGFAFPSDRYQLFSTLNLTENPSGRQSHYLNTVARLAPGVTMEEARADMDRLMATWAADYPDIHTGHFFFMRPLRDDTVGTARTPLLVLMGAVGFVLLVVCVNMANLMLVRGQTRQRETAVRRALGAGRWRLVQSAMAQSLLLALGGAILGLLVARFGLVGLLHVAGDNLPRAAEVRLDGTVLAFIAALSLGSALLFGLLPALKASLAGDLDALADGGRGGTARLGTLRARNALVMAEVALSIVLVIGAGLMIRSFLRLVEDETGFEPGGALIASTSLPAAAYPEGEDITAFYGRLLERVAALPGVASVSASTNLPVYSGSPLNDFQLRGVPEPTEGQPNWNGAASWVRPGYFQAMEIPILKGRGIEASDRSGGAPVVVISESLATRFLPDRDPIGMQMRFGTSDEDDPWWTIVGVVGDVQIYGLGQRIGKGPAYYLAHEQAPSFFSGLGWLRYMTLVVRTSADPMTLAPSIRSAVRELDPTLPVMGVQPYERALADSVSQPRLITTLMGVFAVVALLLGAVGIYGVTAFAVAQRRHEIGIRLALGARREAVAGLVIRKGMAPVLWGVGIGVVLAGTGSRLIESLLFEVSRTDVATYGVVAGILAAVGLVACWLPARRAMAVDPVTTLKAE